MIFLPVQMLSLRHLFVTLERGKIKRRRDWEHYRADAGAGKAFRSVLKGI